MQPGVPFNQSIRVDSRRFAVYHLSSCGVDYYREADKSTCPVSGRRTAGTADQMSISTRSGDHGTTGLRYNRRVAKNHPRVEALGCVDELNAALGLARAHTSDARLAARLQDIQRDLLRLMGELATDPADRERHQRDGFPVVDAALTARLDQWVAELEPEPGRFSTWALPGPPPAAAALELARTLCRRAERAACALSESHGLPNREMLAYLNRLADVLWLFARLAEAPGGRPG